MGMEDVTRVTVPYRSRRAHPGGYLIRHLTYIDECEVNVIRTPMPATRP
jgi:hypothetical protein